MQTVDINEFMAYEPVVTSNDWIVNASRIDVPVTEVIEAAIRADLPIMTTMGFLLERGGLTEDQMMYFAFEICSRVEVNHPFKTLNEIINEHSPDTFGLLNEVRKDWRDARPRSPETSIHSYLFETIISLFTKKSFSQMVNAVSEGKGAKFLGITEQLMGENTALALKMAFYHFYKNRSVEDVSDLLTTLVSDIGLRPPEESDDYDTLMTPGFAVRA